MKKSHPPAEGVFKCSKCQFSVKFDDKGSRPRYLKPDINLLEDAYIMRDPFVDGGSGGIIIGADCCVCDESVCVSPGLCHQEPRPLPRRNSQGTSTKSQRALMQIRNPELYLGLLILSCTELCEFVSTVPPCSSLISSPHVLTRSRHGLQLPVHDAL